jgi:hypothetical protein
MERNRAYAAADIIRRAANSAASTDGLYRISIEPLMDECFAFMEREFMRSERRCH